MNEEAIKKPQQKPRPPFWMIVNLQTAGNTKKPGRSYVHNPKGRPGCVYHEKQIAAADIADLRAAYPDGDFHLLETVPG